MSDIKIDRDNWESLCQEPNLSGDEWRRYYAARSGIYRGHNVGEGLAFIEACVKVEQEAYDRTERATTENIWSDLVRQCDAIRRLQRARIAAYEEWIERKSK